jgi:ribosomal protein S18 acetylase RimI-like enzyme
MTEGGQAGPEPEGALGPVSVVRVDESNWEVYRDVRLAMLSDAPRAFWSTYEDAAARSDEQWQQLVTHLDTWLALRDGRPVGSVGTFQHPEGPPGEGVLVGMWVDPQARGHGVGRRLVQTVLDHAASRGLTRVVLDVAHENAAARTLYEQLGFAPTGRTGAMPHDPTITEFEMQCVLRDLPADSERTPSQPT